VSAASRHRGRRAGARRAFTLIEALATIVILAALGSVVSTVILSAADGYFDASTRAQLHTELSLALDRVVRDLRAIDRDATATGIAPDIGSYATTDLQWQTPQCRLWLSGTTLHLQIDGGATTTLLEDVSAFTITAYDESNAAIAAPKSGSGCDAIRRLAIEVTLTRYGVSETLRTKVFLRSTMEGA
jgi:type II secretory pathway pseudopilin PulG